jgi:hypothetical protein
MGKKGNMLAFSNIFWQFWPPCSLELISLAYQRSEQGFVGVPWNQ